VIDIGNLVYGILDAYMLEKEGEPFVGCISAKLAEQTIASVNMTRI
jgi:hypothetical protein